MINNIPYSPIEAEYIDKYLPHVDPILGSLLYTSNYRDTVDTWFARDNSDDVSVFNDAEWHHNNLSHQYIRMFRAPSYQQVADWLRERKVHILVLDRGLENATYLATIRLANGTIYYTAQMPSYYEAWRAAIIHSLNLLNTNGGIHYSR